MFFVTFVIFVVKPRVTNPRMSDALSRRDFLQATGAGAFASLTAPLPLMPATQTPQGPSAAADASDWFDQPMRWVQLTLVENDPGRFDPAFWLDYFRQLHADAATLSAGGIVAYYPTDVPLHHRSAVARRHRSVRRRSCADAVRSDATSLARTDPHACRDDVQAAHPDWISTAPDGEPRRHWANPSVDYLRARSVQLRVHGRGASRDRHPVPRGRHLREPLGAAGRRLLLRALPGEFPTGDRSRASDIERADAPPGRREFLEWRKARLTELWQHWDATVRAANPEARFVPNGPPDFKTAGDLADIQFADYQARHGVMPPWANGRRAKEYRSVMGANPIGGIFSVGVEEPYRWKDSVQSEPEVQLWVAEGTANGMRPVGDEVLGRPLRSALAAGRPANLPWHFEHERYLRNEAPLARVALLLLGADSRVSPRCRRRRSSRGPRARDVSRARRSAGAVRDGARSAY